VQAHKKTRGIPRVFEYPQGEAKGEEFYRGIYGVSRKVLQGALRRLRQASPYLYQQGIRNLRERGSLS
jgi:hypothetical protein